MLANQTSGYPDYETDPAWLAAFNADPFQIFTYQQRLRLRVPATGPVHPGTNWSYAHTNFMILGHILSIIGKKPLATLLQQKVIGPMGLTNTTSSETSTIPEPVLHSFSSEREVASRSRRRSRSMRKRRTGTPTGGHQTERTRPRTSPT